MATLERYRDIKFIPQPRNWEMFQAMCSHIYEEFFYCTTRPYRRPGQLQHGLDILLNDYRTGPENKRSGIVFIQCKYVSDENLDCPSVRQNMISAHDKLCNDESYEGSIWVSPVYDNPPPRLSSELKPDQRGNYPASLTLQPDLIRFYCDRVDAFTIADINLNDRYKNRGDEFDLCCLLALHRHRPLLSHCSRERLKAAWMGIEVDFPKRPGLR